jgi:hypothetical protein
MALCMEDPDFWAAVRQDYQDQCQLWLCTLPTLTVVHPLEVVSPGCVSLLCRAINSLLKGGTRLSSFLLPKETKTAVSGVESGVRRGSSACYGTTSGVRTSSRVKHQKVVSAVVQTQEKAKPKPRKLKDVTRKAPVTAAPLPSNTK